MKKIVIAILMVLLLTTFSYARGGHGRGGDKYRSSRDRCREEPFFRDSYRFRNDPPTRGYKFDRQRDYQKGGVDADSKISHGGNGYKKRVHCGKETAVDY